jgi:hypothetical protein
MNIFDIFRKRKEIPAPWSKYYTDDEIEINIPNISVYKQLLNTAKVVNLPPKVKNGKRL